VFGGKTRIKEAVWKMEV